MEHIAALLLIVGCSDDLSRCQELPAPTPIYETRQQCDTELPSSLDAFTGQYGQLFAQCISVDPALEEGDAELTWNVYPDGTLAAAVTATSGEVMVASNLPRS